MASPPPHQPQYQEEPQGSGGMSTGTIIAIVAAILFVFLGIPILTCGGCFALGVYRANQAAQQFEDEFGEDIFEPSFENMSEREARELEALKVRVKPILYQHAKGDLDLHYDLPGRRVWKGWYVEHAGDDTFAIIGRLEGGPQVLHWRCEYSADNPKTAERDDWRTERVIVNDEVVFQRDG